MEGKRNYSQMMKLRDFLQEIEYEVPIEGVKKSGNVYVVKDKKTLKKIKEIEDNATVKIGKYWINIEFRSKQGAHYDTAGMCSTVEVGGKFQDVVFRPVFIDIWLHTLKEKK